jgi:hypothetical protein
LYWQIIVPYIGTIGGIIGFFSPYIAKLWCDRSLEKYKSNLDLLKQNLARYSGKQFTLYNEFWQSLQELKIAGDKLWEHANQEHLSDFIAQLNSTTNQIEKSYLFIEDNDYQSLTEIICRLRNYEFGKRRLIDLLASDRISDLEIDRVIKHNRDYKDNYESLIKKIGHDLKSQIKGEH